MAFIFDLDGTLLLLPVDWVTAREELSDMMKGPLDPLNPIFVTLERFLAKEPGRRAEVLALLDRFESPALERTELYPGAREVLEALKPAKLALVTMQGRKAVDSLFRSLRIDGRFRKIITREDSMNRAEQLRMAARALGVDHSAAVFTGDRRNDLEAAKEVGMRFIMMRSLLDSMPDVHSYVDMKELLAALLSENGQVSMVRP